MTVDLQVDRPLHTFSHAFREVLSYAFASLVERRLEGVHARVGIHAKQANSARRLPSTVCAGLRWSDVKDQFGTKSVIAGRDFMVASIAAPTVVDDAAPAAAGPVEATKQKAPAAGAAASTKGPAKKK